MTKVQRPFTIDRMEIVLQVVAALLVLGCALSIWRPNAWWVPMCDFPRAQILAMGLVPVLGLLWIPAHSGVSNLLLIFLTASLLLQAWRIFPYTPLASPQTLRATSTDPHRAITSPSWPTYSFNPPARIKKLRNPIRETAPKLSKRSMPPTPITAHNRTRC